MKLKYRLILQIAAIVIFVTLLNKNFSVIEIYLYGVLYDLMYEFLYRKFITNENKEKHNDMVNLIGNDMVLLIDIICSLLSWFTILLRIKNTLLELKNNNANNR